MKCSPSLLATAISVSLAAGAAAAEPQQLASPIAKKEIATAVKSDPKQSNPQQATAMAGIEVRASTLSDTTSNVATQQKISSQQLELQQASNLTDMLRDVPGVSVTDIGRFGSAGVNIRGLEGDQISMTVDGMALGESLDPASYANYDFFRVGRGGLDPAALKQVNVLKGADAITTGSGSLAGAVQFITKDPADLLAPGQRAGYARVKAEYNGANDEWMRSAMLAGREQGLEALLVLTRREGHQQQAWSDTDQATGPTRTSADPSDQQSDNILAKLVYQLAPFHQLGLTADLQQNQSLLQNLSRVDSTYLSRIGDDESKRYRYGLQYQHSATTTWYDLLNFRYDHQNSANSGLTTMLVTAVCPSAVSPCLRSEDRSFQQKAQQLRLELEKETQSELWQQQWLYGGSFQQKQVHFSAIDRRYAGNSSTIATIDIDPALVPDTQVTEQALFARGIFTFQPTETQLTLGGRFDQIDYQPQLNQQYQDKTATVQDVSFSALNWQAQLKQPLTAQQSVSLQAGRGFRAPTVEDLYLQTATTTAVEAVSKKTVVLLSNIANPALDEERSLSLELAYQLQLDNLQQKVAIFQNKYSNFIETVQKTQNPTVQYQSCFRGMCSLTTGAIYTQVENSGTATVKGIELEGSWTAAPQWRLQWSGAYQRGELDNGLPMLSIAPMTAALGVGYQLQNLPVRVLLSNKFQQRKKAEDALFAGPQGKIVSRPYLSNSFHTLDLSMQWDLTADLQLSAGFFNLFDKQYYRWERIRMINPSQGAVLGGVLERGIERFSEPGRYGKIGLSYQF